MASNRKRKQRNKKRRQQKRLDERVRNWTAVSAKMATGAGQHQDRRTRRKRTRGAQKRAALAEY